MPAFFALFGLTVALLTFGCDERRETPGQSESEYGIGRPEVPADPEAAREDLPDQIDETLEAQREAAEARAQLDALIARACAGVQGPAQTECPIVAGELRSVREIDHGVALSLEAPAEEVDDLEQRMDCYLAHAALRQAQAQAATTGMPPRAVENTPSSEYACIVDSPELDVDVQEADGRIELEITTDDDAEVEPLRARARDLASRASR